MKVIPYQDLTEEQRTLGLRWSILNSWGWPDDWPMPLAEAARHPVALAEMRRIEREIGFAACLSVWNSPAFRAMVPIPTRYDTMIQLGRPTVSA